MAPYSAYNFGVEIETVVRPYALRASFTDKDYYRQLAEKLANRQISAVPDLSSRYCKHPEYYSGKWFITRDGSLRRSHESFICMEIVSPVMNTRKEPSKTISEFWEAINVGFTVQKERSCGGHVHITPNSSNQRFSMSDLRTIAFASVVYEDCVYSILPASRKVNPYCNRNTRESGILHRICQQWGGGLSTQALSTVGSALAALSTPGEILAFMQSKRYVLWNFQHVLTNSSGTVEFRGGNQFLGTNGTLRWIAFVVAFVNLALSENLIQTNNVTYVSPSSPAFAPYMNAWWEKMRQSAKQLKMMRHLPKDWKEMQLS
ncbi:hypothetical protein GQ43DRAFT_442437 [Delitschia confertaspora ATCC 74209]|uniref:Amidoligase enzyme n=1 Tax=Delitschia confertaspora ATCC 74209 TaxID=1513339 RepID=A0A9P4MTW9_9PLEO|nr:hypothetical protein GQ43DRAFT_442437 [Delitschia confertaspora ATCC 74209]